MPVPLAAVIALVLIASAIPVLFARRAADGYEDDEGFHPGPVPGMRRAAAGPAPVRPHPRLGAAAAESEAPLDPGIGGVLCPWPRSGSMSGTPTGWRQ